MSQVHVDALRCPYCHDSIAGAAPKRGCETCLAWSHKACLLELGRCANCEASAQEARVCSQRGCPREATLEIHGGPFCRGHAEHAHGNMEVWGAILLVIGLAFLLSDAVFSETWLRFFLSAATSSVILAGSAMTFAQGRSMRREFNAAVEALEVPRAQPTPAPAGKGAPALERSP